MSFKAVFDIFVYFSHINISQFHKIGLLYYQTSIYYTKQKNGQKVKKFCFPCNVVEHKPPKSEKLKAYGLSTIQSLSLPHIAQDHTHFVSKTVPVNYDNYNFTENTSCYFKAYINVQQIDDIDFFIEVNLMYKPSNNENYKFISKQSSHELISTFTGKINKPYDILTLLPINLDDFQSIKLYGTYHSVISELKFSNQEEQQFQKQQSQISIFSFSKKQTHLLFPTFKEYLNNITEKFVSKNVRIFYNYYRKFLINSYNSLIDRSNHYNQLLYQYLNGFKEKQKLFKDQNNFKVSKKVLTQFDQMYRKNLNYQKFQRAKQLLCEYMLQDFHQIKQQIYEKWSDFNKIIEANPLEIIFKQLQNYTQLIEQRYKNNIFSHTINIQKGQDLTFSRYDDGGKSHISQAQLQNTKEVGEVGLWKDSFLIQDISFIQKQKKNIKMFEQIYPSYYFSDNSSDKTIPQKNTSVRNIQSQKQFKKTFLSNNQIQISTQHIIFLVHGFGACKTDLLLLQRFISTKYIRSQVVISIQNIGRTEQSLENCGERLADQVKMFCGKISGKFRLSFIGHSMGGLIIRSALLGLQKYRDNFHSYISICTPHLGYLYEPSNLTKVGLWMLSQMQSCESLNQIQMKDNANLRRTFLYNLSASNGLSYFKHIAFIASSQDYYVPYQSARVQKSVKLLKQLQEKQDHIKISVIKQMIDNMIKNLVKANQISRFNVVFNIEQKFSWQNIIGRIGHVKFLSDQQFIQEFVICFKKFFQ